MRFRQIVQVEVPPETVWMYLEDLERRPEWDHRLRGVEVLGPLRVGLEGKFQKLRGTDQRFSVHQWVRGERLRIWESAPVGALEWEYRLEKKDGGTQIILEVTPTGGGRYIGNGRLETFLKVTGERLKNRLEDPSDQPPRYPFTLEGFPMVHRAMRKDLSRLDALLRRIQVGEGVDVDVVRAWFAFSWAIAQGHHVGEDAQVFPRVAARSPEFRKAWKVVEVEHAEIDRMVIELDRRLQKGIDGLEVDETLSHLHLLRDYLEGHLIREEVAFERAIRSEWDPEEQIELQNVLRQAIPLKLIELVVPWMLEAATPEERKKVLSQLPLPARLLYHLSWQDHYHTLLQPFSGLPI
jgi:hemerythrin-like domain-containing protein